MALYYPDSCETEVPDHVCDPCETLEKGRVSSVALITDPTFEFLDVTDPTEWIAGIESGAITVIPEVVGSFDGGTEVEGPGYGRQSTKLISYDFVLNFRDPNYKSNCEYWNAVKRLRTVRLVYVTETQAHYVDVPVSLIPKSPVTEELNSDVVYDVTAKWSSPDLPCPVNKPAGIFDACVYAD